MNIVEINSVTQAIQATQQQCQAPLSFGAVIGIVIGCCILGLIWAIINMLSVNKIDVEKGIDGQSDSLVGDIPESQKQLLIELGDKIANVK